MTSTTLTSFEQHVRPVSSHVSLPWYGLPLTWQHQSHTTQARKRHTPRTKNTREKAENAKTQRWIGLVHDANQHSARYRYSIVGRQTAARPLRDSTTLRPYRMHDRRRRTFPFLHPSRSPQPPPHTVPVHTGSTAANPSPSLTHSLTRRWRRWVVGCLSPVKNPPWLLVFYRSLCLLYTSPSPRDRG